MVRCDIVGWFFFVFLAASGVAQYDNCTSSSISLIGNAFCNSKNNNLACGYDGGDCCECTCVDSSEHACGPLFSNCLDPTCVDPLVAEYPNCTGDIFSLNNGLCDTENNNPDCGYDGGDCCECTCLDTNFFACEDFLDYCEDPACLDAGVATTYPNCTDTLFWIGDGFCDEDTHNNPDCGYDGGDCCGCTCVDGTNYFCELYLSDCIDPTCVDPLMAAYPNCTGDIFSIGNGVCDPENNNSSCGYDGGDCCICTCIDGDRDCLSVVFDCVDPDAGDELYGCKEPPLAAVPCSDISQGAWVVQDTAGAKALAEAVNCSGGVFEVEWRGDIVVQKPIYVVDGTVLNITGVGSSAGINGNGTTRLFTVNNASLHVSGLNVSHGVSIAGGAIAAKGSTLTFNGTRFMGNDASGFGGALFLSGNSSVSCVGTEVFSGNNAIVDGGALYVSATSVISWIEETFFLNNTAGAHGGAVMVVDGSSVSWGGETMFSGNIGGDAGIRAAGSGGALYVGSNSTVSWAGETTFSDSTAPFGGGVVVRDSSRVSWDQKTRFAGNIADDSGGALLILSGSSVSWSGETTFADNNAISGGAMTIDGNCSVSWSGNTTFVGNAAGVRGGAVHATNGAIVSSSGGAVFAANSAGEFGGALSVSESNVAWYGDAQFVNNFAVYGGGLNVVTKSNVSFGGETAIFSGNSAIYGGGLRVEESSIRSSGKVEFIENMASNRGGAVFAFSNSKAYFEGITAFDGNGVASDEPNGGGAVFVVDSDMSCSGQVTFRNNWGRVTGGAVWAQTSIMSFSGDTSFFNNSADSGGALSISMSSSCVWQGDTSFFNNSAILGGALYIVLSSTCAWQGNAEFVNNSADFGGAIIVTDDSSVWWSADTSFAGNNANSSGGTISTAYNSRVSWSGDTRFIHSSAGSNGGAIEAKHNSSFFWSGDTLFLGNKAESGGAVYISNGSDVGWDGRTDFVSNSATEFEGGAIGSYPADTFFNPQDSTLIINGTTNFVNNTCRANGGGLALLGALSLSFGTTDVTFSGNSADVSGGAVFISSTSVGPVFPGTRFVSNVAQIGGAVYITGTGATQISVEGFRVNNPTTFVGCSFVGNEATTTGGAVESAAGQDLIVNTVFVGNTARVGGALRLAGTANLNKCSFVENVSDEGSGPAISNIGYVSQMIDSDFVGNAFDCKPGEFLDYNSSGNIYDAVCDGCYSTCAGCSFAEPEKVPTCTDVMEHSTSPGGAITLEELHIESGYWRATTTSREVLACYNADACLGGVTASSDYCDQGYEGPYCSICSNGYTANMVFVCGKCSDSTGGIALAVVLTAIAVVAVVIFFSYLVSGKREGTRRGIADRIWQHVPFRSLKIVIVAWQIVTQFSSVANVTYPEYYQRLLDGVDVLNFDLSWIISAGCIFEVDFHDRLLISTIGPIVAASFLGVTYAVGLRRNRGSEDSLHIVQHKHVTMMLLLTFLVYSSITSILFQMFACEKLEDGRNYLRSDYRIECDSSRHRELQIYAGFMISLYTVGIPAWYAGLLFSSRNMLKDVAGRNDNLRIGSIADLWEPYKPRRFYYEVIECARRILLAGVVVFIYPNTAAQIAVTLMLAFVFFGVAEALSPYVSRWDRWVSRMGHVIVYVSMYFALLLKVDVSGDRAGSQRVFEVVLVSAHACMILTVVIEAVVIACSLRMPQREISTPRFRGDKTFKWYKESRKVKDGPPRDDFRSPNSESADIGEQKE